jgi:UDP-N-acetyl-alpha-D-muramoyl-L-alanyl-L-glutamate epimerase
MSETLSQLRTRHPRFEYRRATWRHEPSTQQLVVEFEFLLAPDIEFRPSLVFHDVSAERVAQLDPQVIQHLVFEIGMVEILSYWKAACPSEIVISAGILSDAQRQFHLQLLQNGLSEFFYLNQIEEAWNPEFVTFVQGALTPSSETITPSAPTPGTQLQQRTLIPMGGGKDSVVTRETLREANAPFALMVMEYHNQPKLAEVLAVHAEDVIFRVDRTLDPRLLELNRQGYLNGHTPFSALLSFVSVLTAYLHDFAYVALSNEHSANEPNIVWNGHDINHQYSKSLEYERAVQQRVAEIFAAGAAQATTHAAGPHYFSFLRPLAELHIAAAFTQWPEYFGHFLSCNRGQKQGKWCGECPKCVFVAIMLGAFLPPSELTSIFTKPMFEDENLWPIIEELTGLRPTKSFECVGLREESRIGLWLALERHPELKTTAWGRLAIEKIFSTQPVTADTAREFLTRFESLNTLPAFFQPIMEQIQAHTKEKLTV